MYQGETESETKYLRYYRGNTYNYGSRDYFYCTSTVNQRNLAGKYVFKFKNCIQSHKEHKQSQHFFFGSMLPEISNQDTEFENCFQDGVSLFECACFNSFSTLAKSFLKFC